MNDVLGFAEKSDDVNDKDKSAEWVRYDLAEEFNSAIEAAQIAVKQGKCIVIPTDTVYGIASNPFSSDAVMRLLEAKQRGRDMPPPVLIAEPSMMRALASFVPPAAKKLAEKFWPGALTIILKAQNSLNMDLGNTEGTVAIRVPDHDGTRKLLRKTGPLAVSSANISGNNPAITCQEAIDQLGDKVVVYLDAGSSTKQEPSTIIDFTNVESGEILRQGALSFEQLSEVVPDLKPVV